MVAAHQVSLHLTEQVVLQLSALTKPHQRNSAGVRVCRED